MDYLNTFKNLDQQIVYSSLAGKVLSILSEGTNGAWLLEKNGYYVWAGDCWFGCDLLKRFDFIRQGMSGKSLCISFRKNKFVAELSQKMLDGGYDEPLQNVVVESTKGNSIFQALKRMNDKLRKELDDNNEILGSENGKPKLCLVKS